MSAFPFHHHPFHFDSVFLPNMSSDMLSFQEQGPFDTSLFSHDTLSDSLPLIGISAATHESSSLVDNGSDIAFSLEKHPDNFSNETPVVEVEQQHQTDTVASSLASRVPSVDKKRKNRDNSRQNSAQTREGKGRAHMKSNSSVNKHEKIPKTDKKRQKKDSEQELPTGYIHVRARRGQATDSHSLAERVRRLRINERMKLLQGLVPGCDKVTGKALMLDKIINYVQSLQNQVEFLSMKLASVSPVFYDFSTDLDIYMAKSEKQLNVPSEFSLAFMEQASHNQPSAISESTTATFHTTTNFSLLDSSAAALLQVERSKSFSQGNTNIVWTAHCQRERLLNQLDTAPSVLFNKETALQDSA